MKTMLKNTMMVCLTVLMLVMGMMTGLCDEVTIQGYDAATDSYTYVQVGFFDQIGVEEPIIWRVLAREGDHALLLSEKVLLPKRYDGDSTSWRWSNLKAWLNGDFLTYSFYDREMGAIIENDSLGKIFILSKNELKNPAYGFDAKETAEDPNRAAEPTPVALSNGIDSRNGKSIYYTRTESSKGSMAAVVSTGKIMQARIERKDVGVRPAMWVDLTQLNLNAGAGTVNDPYRFFDNWF